MDQIFEKFDILIQTHGIAAYFSIGGLIIFYIIGFISIWLAIGMLIYSILSKNWSIWRKWKYIGYLALLGIGLLILGIIIRVIMGALAG